jgi:hypothetical protein
MPPALTAVFTRRPRASVSLCRLPSPPALIWSSFSCCFSLFGLWDFRCGRPQLHRRNAARKSITLYAKFAGGQVGFSVGSNRHTGWRTSVSRPHFVHPWRRFPQPADKAKPLQHPQTIVRHVQFPPIEALPLGRRIEVMIIVIALAERDQSNPEIIAAPVTDQKPASPKTVGK